MRFICTKRLTVFLVRTSVCIFYRCISCRTLQRCRVHPRSRVIITPFPLANAHRGHSSRPPVRIKDKNRARNRLFRILVEEKIQLKNERTC